MDFAKELFAENQNPLILTLSAENDKATKILFPIGQCFAIDCSLIRRTTLGNYKNARTHNLFQGNAQAPKLGSVDSSWWYDHFCAGTICLSRRPDLPATGDPFIVAQAPKTIIDGHSKIWTENLQTFLIDFIAEMQRRQFPSAHEEK